MGVRLAEPSDITGVISVGKRILARTTYGADVCDVQARRYLMRAINDKTMNLWIADHKGAVVGFLLAGIDQHWFSKKKYACDITFVMSDNHGNYAPPMIRKYLKWGKSFPGVTDVFMGITSGLDNDGRIGRMLENIGLTNIGGNYALLEK